MGGGSGVVSGLEKVMPFVNCFSSSIFLGLYQVVCLKSGNTLEANCLP